MTVIQYFRNSIRQILSDRPTKQKSALSREDIASRYLNGSGIEIGALHKPLKVSHSTNVKYLDRMSAESLRQHYPELKEHSIVPVDIIDDGETLATISDASQDFVIANHFFEHCQNPIKTVSNMLRVLIHDGVLYLSIPDKRYIFDRDRPVTKLAHLIKDYFDGPEWSRKPAFEEYVRFVDKIKDETEAQKKVALYLAMDYSIHYHVWTEIEMLELLVFLNQNLKIPFLVELVVKNDIEVIMILRKD